MSQLLNSFDELREAVLAGQLNRRDVLRRGIALGLSAPVIGALLAACGGDDDDDDSDDETATEAEGAATEEATEAATEEATEAETEEETEASTEEAEETEAATEEATEDDAEATQAETEAEGGDSGEWQSSEVDPLTMGMEFDEPTGSGGLLIEGDISDISTLNPILRSDGYSATVIFIVFESLFKPNPTDLTPVGHLAKEWKVSDDGLTWTIKIRDGVTWHDGEPFTANDVAFSYQLYMNPDTTGPWSGDLNRKIESVTAIDDETVEFKLKLVNADFQIAIGSLELIAEHIWKDVDPTTLPNDPGSNGTDPSRVVGTGPFIFQEWLVEDRVTCIANENYWGGKPYLDEWIYRYVGDATAVLQALKVGDIDTGSIVESTVGELDGTEVGVYNYPTLSFTFYGTNLDPEKSPYFQDVAVRKAMLYALDREALIESIRFGYGTVAVGTMPVLSWAYNPDGIEEELRYEYDPEKAKQLLDEAGWVPGDDGVRQKDGLRLSFPMQTNAGNEVREQYLTAFQEFWREIGIEMTPQLEPFPAVVERITSTFDFDIFLIGFGWDATPGQETMFACDSYPSGFNTVRYCNPQVDELLQKALTTLDRDERIEIYTEMQNIFLNDCPIAVLDFPEAITGINNRVHNRVANAVNTRFNAHLWWVES